VCRCSRRSGASSTPNYHSQLPARPAKGFRSRNEETSGSVDAWEPAKIKMTVQPAA
jgi:hypothetical protein